MKFNFEKIRDSLDKYNRCAAMLEEDIRELSEYFSCLDEMVKPLGQEFGIMKKEISLSKERLRSNVNFIDNK